MNRSGLRKSAVSLSAVLLLGVDASAQRQSQPAGQQATQPQARSTAPGRESYDLGKEVSLQGTVVSFDENSTVPPLGPHVVVQTSSGKTDIHLGDARLLQANHFTLAAGDSVRVIGESVPYGGGTQFLARIIQKGSQTLALRSTRGFPLRPLAKAGKSQAGAL